MKLLPNRTLPQLSKETDSIGVFEKAEFLKNFFINIKDQDELKIFSLYGDWGSGKSTVLRYLEKELKGEYNTFFFEAWEHDHNDNIAFSLLEFLVDKTTDHLDKDLEKTLKVGWEFLKGFGKSLKFNVNVPLVGGAEFEPAKIIEQLENNQNPRTPYIIRKEFKEQFLKLEGRINKEGKPNKNIVFIDDLDRCDPEQTLALLSAIKLFFTYGEKTIFVCGIDKKAVEEAIKTKYHDYIKSNEYLEKIFDVSFSMPQVSDIYKLVSLYFENVLIDINDRKESLITTVCDLFSTLHLYNPRKIKKVLNKYQLISIYNYNKSEEGKHIYIKGNHDFCFPETIITLYLVVLNEFYLDEFRDFLNINKKMGLYSKFVSSKKQSPNDYYFLNDQLIYKSLNELDNDDELIIMNFCYIFLPTYLNEFNQDMMEDDYYGAMTVSKSNVELYFYRFLMNIGISAFLKGKTSNNLIDIKSNVEMMG